MSAQCNRLLRRLVSASGARQYHMQVVAAFVTLTFLMHPFRCPMTARDARHSLSLTYVQRLLAGAARQGVSLPALFVASGIEVERFNDPNARFSGAELIRLIQVLMQQTHDEFIGLATDVRSKPGTFSMMAHAVINCANLEKAIRRSAAFYELFETPAYIRFEVINNEGRVTLDVREYTPFACTVHELMVFVSLRFWSWLVGRRLDPLVIEFAFDAPPSAHEFQRLFKCPVNYGMDANVIRFPASWLTLPLAQNPLSLSRFLKDSIAVLFGGKTSPVGLAEQIRGILGKTADSQFPELAEIAALLNLTAQTLRRRLKDEGTSYQVIKDQVREQAARFYLAKPALTIDEIALMMGFSEASAFHRAFKKWTGMTPTACRLLINQTLAITDA